VIYNQLTHTTRKYWHVAYCDNIECAVCHDGQLFMFDYDDIATLLANYTRDKIGWFFNDSHDRYIAELIADDRVTVNPQFCYQNFKDIVT
jgi:hypothetical protein